MEVAPARGLMIFRRDFVIIWVAGHWRCELHPAARGKARLKIFRGEKLEVIEPTLVGPMAYDRAEILRRLLCGDCAATDAQLRPLE